MSVISENMRVLKGYVADFATVIGCKNAAAIDEAVHHSREMSEAFEEGLQEIKTSLKELGLKTNKDMMIYYICSEYIAYNINYTVMNDINLYDSVMPQEEIAMFRQSPSIEDKTSYAAMCLENLSILSSIVQLIWKAETIHEVDTNELVSKGGVVVTWLQNHESLMRFYRLGSEKTWRLRFLQQLGVQFDKQISLLTHVLQ